MRFWLDRFSCLRDGVDVEEQGLEFALHQVDQFQNIDLNERIDRVWANFKCGWEAEVWLSFIYDEGITGIATQQCRCIESVLP